MELNKKPQNLISNNHLELNFNINNSILILFNYVLGNSTNTY
jgi:hypothetical protein